MVHRKLPDLPYPSDQARILATLGEMRDEVRRIMDGVRPFGSAYIACAEIRTKIDYLAELMTGDDRFFVPVGNRTPGGSATRPEE